jgi:hypothetical protein
MSHSSQTLEEEQMTLRILTFMLTIRMTRRSYASEHLESGVVGPA